jgi:hypothetical protein
MIYDIFTFFYEIDLLEIRLNILDKFLDKFGWLGKTLNKMGDSMFKYVMMGFTFMKNMISPLLGPLTAIGMALMGVTKGAIGKLLGLGGSLLGGAAGGMAKMAMTGVGTLGLGGLAYAGMQGFSGMSKAGEWLGIRPGETGPTVGQKAMSFVGGALGGTEESFSAKGAGKGALKGAAIGAGIGSMIAPGVGTAIGGAVGAIAGGILGFIGGENIAKGLDYATESIKKLAGAVWKFITWPARMTWKFLKKGYVAIKENLTMVKDFWVDKSKLFLDPIMGIFTYIFELGDKIKKYLMDKIQAIPGVKKLMNLGKEKKEQEKAKKSIVKPKDDKEKKLMWLQRRMSEPAYNLLGNNPERFEELKNKGYIKDTSSWYKTQYWEATDEGMHEIKKMNEVQHISPTREMGGFDDVANVNGKEYKMDKSGQLTIDGVTATPEVTKKYVQDQSKRLGDRINSGNYGSEVKKSDMERKTKFDSMLGNHKLGHLSEKHESRGGVGTVSSG